MPLADLIKDVAIATGFLTRLPLPARLFAGVEARPLAATVWAFPLVGALTGLLVALPAIAFGPTPLVAGVLAALTRALLTGFLHDDGLGDFADAYWGGHTIARRLEIMKDSRIGTYGAMTLMMALLLEVTTLTAIAGAIGWEAMVAACIAALALGRAVMVLHWHRLPNARPDGVAARSGVPGLTVTRLAGLFGLAALLPALIALPIAAAPLAALAALLASVLMTKASLRAIGGATGDTMGATERITALSVLTALAFACN